MSKLSHDEVLKMTKLRKIILAIMVLMLLSSVGYGADWKYYGSSSDLTCCFYDTQSVSCEQNITKVSDMRILSNRCKAEYIKRNLNNPKIEDINYTIDKLEINCSKNLINIRSTILYDSKGGVIRSFDYPEPEFQEVVPESIEAELVEIFCKKDEGK
jgi:hypothetical protein